ncbi:MAG TPA: PKD domain-containing protein, partial [Cytophagaceae bacterium]
MRKLIYIHTLIFCLISLATYAQNRNRIGSKDCSTAPILCNNDIIFDSLMGQRNRPGFNDRTNQNTCFPITKNEVNPFWYKFTPQNNGKFEMYLNAPEGLDFDFIIYDITNGCATKQQVSCNASQVDLFNDEVGTGLSDDSASYYDTITGAANNPFSKSLQLDVTKTYAVFIESSQLRSSDPAFKVTFGGSAIFKNVRATIAADNDSICLGNTITFANPPTNGFSGVNYNWNFGDGTTSTLAAPNHTYAQPGTYKVKLTADNGSCKDFDSVLVTVKVTVNADAGPDKLICAGNSTTLSASGGTSYLWTPTNQTSSSISVSPIVSTQYILRVSDAGNCYDYDTVKVDVKPNPILTTSPSTAICQGDSVKLTVSGASSYFWIPGNQTTNSINAKPINTTLYKVIGTDLSGCKDSASITVTVNSAPTINAGPDQSICAGSAPITITATGGTSYLWSPTNSTAASITVNPLSTTKYIV